MTGNKIELTIDHNKIISSNKSTALLGIYWQDVSGCAANSLCQGTVFLEDTAAANKWTQNKNDFNILQLDEAIDCSSKYFSDLLIIK